MMIASCCHSNEVSRLPLYPCFHKKSGCAKADASYAYVESGASLTARATTKIFTTPPSVKKLNAQLENVPIKCPGCITDLITQASQYLEKAPETAALYLATAFERCEQIVSSELSQQAKSLLEQALQACKAPESQGLFKYLSLQYKNVNLIIYMAGRDISLIQAKYLDENLYQILRECFNRLCSQDVSGIRKNFYEKFQIVLKNKLICSLKGHYLQKNEILLLTGGSLPIKDHYTNLAIITEKERKEKKEALRDPRPTTYETIFQPKESIQLEKIFERKELEGASHKRILIQGSAGIGKSTLCQRIACQWAQGELWREFKAIFWIKFRDLAKNYQNRADINEVIVKECLLDQEAKIVLTDEGFRNNCLLVLDGYDELSDKKLEFKTSNKEGYLPVIKAFQNEFPHIIITTRPQDVEDFEKIANLEILGFENAQIDEYIEKFFHYNEKDPEEKVNKKKEGKQALKAQFENQLIRSLCHIPINLEIFCSLAVEGEAFPKNQSLNLATIYDKLTTWLMERFGKERLRGTSFQYSTNLKAIEIQDFVDAVLENIAWKMMMQNTLAITFPQIKKVIRDLKIKVIKNIDIDQIGPLRINENERQFIHLTFQEFFAAKYLVQQYATNEKRDVAKVIVAENKFNPRFGLVLRLTAGILSQNDDEKYLQAYFDDLFFEPCDYAKSYETILFAQCFEECINLEAVKNFYNKFFDQLKTLMEDSSLPLKIKFRILMRNNRLLETQEIKQLLEDNFDKFLTLFQKIAEENIVLPERIYKLLINNLNSDGTSDFKNTIAIVYTINELCKNGKVLVKEDIEEIFKFVKNKNNDAFARITACEILEKIDLIEDENLLVSILSVLECEKELKSYLYSNISETCVSQFYMHPLGDFTTIFVKLAKKTKSSLDKEISFLKERFDKFGDTHAFNILQELAIQGNNEAIEALQLIIKNPTTPGFSFLDAFSTLLEIYKEGKINHSCTLKTQIYQSLKETSEKRKALQKEKDSSLYEEPDYYPCEEEDDYYEKAENCVYQMKNNTLDEKNYQDLFNNMKSGVFGLAAYNVLASKLINKEKLPENSFSILLKMLELKNTYLDIGKQEICDLLVLLGKIENSFSNKELNDLINLYENGDDNIKNYCFEIFSNLNFNEFKIQNDGITILSKICFLSGRAFYQNQDGKYYIADRTKVLRMLFDQEI